MNDQHAINTKSTSARRGSVLVVVLVVVMMLTLGVYTFSQIMLAELKTTVVYERDVRTRAYADSGIELVAAVLGERTDEFSRANLYDNPALFYQVMNESESARDLGSFSILAPRENDTGANPIRYGLVDESTKLNLNTLLNYGLEDDELQELLLKIPNMTVEVASAILDWIDEDVEPRQSGAENEYYGSLDPPYETKNEPLETLDELLRVRGVTGALLFGEDANRNGLLDPNENDGDASYPYDNGDGVLDRGWSAYLTVFSREANRRADGELRIDVNQESLADLYDAVEEEFDSETALFVAAYRLNGPDEEPVSNERPGRSSQSSGNRNGGRGQAGGQSGGGSQTGTASESRGGLDLSGGGSQTVNSLYELVGATVTARVNGVSAKLESPWKNDAGSIDADLPTLLDRLTTSSEAFIEGRINISQAPREVLLTIPQIEEQVVEAIIGAQVNAGSAAFEAGGPHSTTGWLLSENLVDLAQMRSLDRFITARGDVYRVQSLGYFDEGSPVTRLEAVIDATQTPPAILSVRDLSDLGPGFPVQPQQTTSP